jgi:hypothetical protein
MSSSGQYICAVIENGGIYTSSIASQFNSNVQIIGGLTGSTASFNSLRLNNGFIGTTGTFSGLVTASAGITGSTASFTTGTFNDSINIPTSQPVTPVTGTMFYSNGYLHIYDNGWVSFTGATGVLS